MPSFDDLTVNFITIKGASASDDVTLGGLADVGTAATAAAPDAVTVQAAVIAAPSALTGSAPAALTAAASVDVPTKVEFDKVVADAVASRTALAAAVVDVAALHAKVTALLAALKGAGKPMSAS